MQEFYDDGAQSQVKLTNVFAFASMQDVTNLDTKHPPIAGPLTQWYPNGANMTEARFIDGLVEGAVKWWHDNGWTARKAFYQKGQIQV